MENNFDSTPAEPSSPPPSNNNLLNKLKNLFTRVGQGLKKLFNRPPRESSGRPNPLAGVGAVFFKVLEFILKHKIKLIALIMLIIAGLVIKNLFFKPKEVQPIDQMVADQSIDIPLYW